jgi:hypothetical protein
VHIIKQAQKLKNSTNAQKRDTKQTEQKQCGSSIKKST